VNNICTNSTINNNSCKNKEEINFSNNDNLIECNSGYYNYNNLCNNCSNNGKECDINRCFKCNDNYTLIEYKICESINNCSLIEDNQCKSCSNGYSNRIINCSLNIKNVKFKKLISVKNVIMDII